MSPILSARGGLAANAYGWAALSADAKYYIARLSSSSGTDAIWGVACSGTDVYLSGQSPAFIYKMTGGAVETWDKVLTATGNTYFKKVRLDSSGNVYVAGYDDNGNRPNVLMKLSSTPTITWQRALRVNTEHTQTEDIAVNSSGVPHIPMYHWTGAPNYKYDGYVAKYDTNGSVTWQRQFTRTGQSNDVYLERVALDSSDNVFVGGWLYNNSLSLYYGWVAKLDSSGNLSWQRQYNQASTSGSTNRIRSLVTDSSGNLYGVGEQVGTVGNACWAYFAKWNSSGTLQWQQQIASADSSNYGVAVDSTGSNIYVVGISYVSSLYRMNIYKINSSGSLQWQRQLYQSGVNTFAGGIALNSDDDIFVTGYTTFTDADGIIARLKNDGSLTGTYTLNGASMIYSASSLTYQSSTATEAAGSLTVQNGSANSSTPSYAITDGTKTISKVGLS